MEEQKWESFLQEMVRLKNYRTKRISSWDKTGGNFDFLSIPAGERVTLADIKGPGCIKHIYFTIGSLFDHFYFRNLILRMYWDNEKKPSVEVPLGDFFGIGHCKVRYFTSLLLTVNPGDFSSTDNHGLNCYFPMPFFRRAVIEVVNESDFKLNNLWYHIDYEEYESLDDDLGRFHAQWRRENSCKAILPEGEELVEKERKIYEVIQKKGGAFFWAKYSKRDREKIIFLRGHIKKEFKEEYQKASSLWGHILEIVKIEI